MNNTKLISIYKGENRILIIPIIRHIGGYSIDSDWCLNIKDTENEVEIGKGIFCAIDVIKNSPPSSKSSNESEMTWRKNSKYKSWNSFWSNNNWTCVGICENGEYGINSYGKSVKEKGLYSDCLKQIVLPQNSTVEDVGRAVIECFSAVEEFYANPKNSLSSPMRGEIKLISESATHKSVSYEIPKSNKFIDAQDYHSASVYQGYSYCPNNDNESIAEFYFGTGYEEDYNLNPENIRSSWEKHDVKSDFFEIREVEHPIFAFCAEMRSKAIHKIVYYKEFADCDIFTCEMVVNQPNRRKKIDEKLTKKFEKFVQSCRWETNHIDDSNPL